MQGLVSRALSLALTAACAVFVIGATQGSANAAPVATKFAYGASGFGTLVRGGQVPAGSDMTAFRPLGCTNLAGVTKENHEAASPLGGFGNVSAVKTQVGTTKVGNVHTSYARNTIASVTLGDPSLGAIAIQGISSTSKAFHNATGYHATTRTTVAKITFAPLGMDPQVIEIPSPGQPVEIPGVARISVGTSVKQAGANGAQARANALEVKMLLSGSKATIGHSAATISGGITVGVFQGRSFSTRVNALDANLTSGPTPLTVMPCQGTHGIVRTRKIASIDLGGQVVVGAVTSSQMGDQKAGKAYGWEKATVSKVDLGDGQLIVTGIVGKVSVTRTAVVGGVSRAAGVITANANGTTVGSIVANGEEMAFPDTDVLEIPGVAKLEQNIVTKGKIGIKVIALRITLLDGSGAVIDLGTAELRIKNSGL